MDHQLDFQMNVQGCKRWGLNRFGPTRIDARCSCGHIFYTGWPLYGDAEEEWRRVFEAVLTAYTIHFESEK